MKPGREALVPGGSIAGSRASQCQGPKRASVECEGPPSLWLEGEGELVGGPFPQGDRRRPEGAWRELSGGEASLGAREELRPGRMKSQPSAFLLRDGLH